MLFEKRHEEIIKKVKPHTERELWFNTLVFSLLVFIALSFYIFLRRGYYNLFLANKIFASSAVVIIGLSFALSGLCYFFDFLDTKIIYRKHLGLAGFAFAIVHTLISLFALPEEFPFPEYYLVADHLLTFIFGILAMVIFTMMAAISNKYAVHELGGSRWRLLLRTGYIAYALVIAHFVLMKYKGWINWIVTKKPSPLPPLSLLIAIFSILVVLLRIALWFALSFKKKPTLTTATNQNAQVEIT